MYSLILDVLVILTFLIFMFIGFKKGFVKSLISLVGTLASVFLAFYISGFVSTVIYENIIEPSIISKIEFSLKTSNSNVADEIFKNTPDFVVKSISEYGITKDKIQVIIVGNSTNTIPKKIASLFSPAIINALRIIFTAVLFFVFMLLVKFMGSALSKICKVPVLKQIDGVLGAVFSIFKCYLILMVFALCIRVYVGASPKPFRLFLPENINSSKVFVHIYENDLFKNLY